MTAREWECRVCGAPLRIEEAAEHVRRCCPDPPSRADLADDEDDAAGTGDATLCACPRCPAELPLSDLLDHVEVAHPVALDPPPPRKEVRS